MPRPKRAKVAPSAPAPRVRKANPKAIQAAPQASKAPFDDLYDVSDPEDRVMRKTGASRTDKGDGKVIEALSARKQERNMSRRDSYEPEQAQVRRTQDESNEPMDTIVVDTVLESSSPEIEVGRREHRTPAVESSTLALGNFRRRPRQPSILGRAAARARSSSVESNLAEPNGLTSVRKRNTSSMATGNFRRRVGEPSILATTSANIATCSVQATPKVGSAMKIGNFKRRAREPSILRTAQKDQQHRDLDFEDEDEDDFNPDDESTPLNLPKTRDMVTASATSSSNPRKRKLSAVQVPRSSPIVSPIAALEEPEEDRIPGTGSVRDEEEEDQAESTQEDELIPSIEGRSESPEPLSETMAPPQSSSSVPSSPVMAPRHRRAPSRGRGLSRVKTPQPRYNDDSPIPSLPSLTHSPDLPPVSMTKPKPKPKSQAPPPSTFSTRQLQALLPRRRHRPARDVFDIASSEDEVDASGLASEDDELTHINPRARSRRLPSVVSRTPAPPARKVTKLKSASLPKSTDTIMPKKAKRTYGSRGNVTSDKENEEADPDDDSGPLPEDENEVSETSQELEKRIGKEMKKAARKFQEVDKWDLEFEDITADSSSPKDAR